MADEIMVPMLPCPSIDEIVEFYTMLGFSRAYYQKVPNPYVSLRREDIRLDFFGIPGFDPEDSYGTCGVLVSDTGALFDSFAAGMRRVHGKLLVSGIPRMTRPRIRKNDGNRTGFTVIDPGGNWVRFMTHEPSPTPADPAATKLTTSLRRAIVMGDSHGKHVRAAEILDAALERDKDTATPAELVESLTYRAELALRAEDFAAAEHALTRARAVHLEDADRERLARVFAELDEMEAGLRTARDR